MTEEKKSIESEILEDLEIDETKLNEELQKQPGKFFYYTSQWARAARSRRRTKLNAAEREAVLAKEYREIIAKETPGQRVTERMLTDYLNNHPEYLKLQEDIIKSEYMEDVLEATRDSMRQRHQVLLELSRAAHEERIYGNDITSVAGMRAEFEEREARKSRKRTPKQLTTNTKPE